MRQNKAINKTDILRIGIIGSGFSGVSCFVNIIDIFLSENIQRKIEITLFDKNIVNGRGLAYSTHCAAHLLNTPSDTVGILPNRKDDFKKWLWSKLKEGFFTGCNIDPQHPPREIYGQYVEEMFELYVQKAASLGINTHKKKQEVTEIFSANHEYIINTKENSSLTFNYIILAVGGFHSAKLDFLKSFNGYITSPYDNEFNSKVAQMNDVLIIGTRLSCVDSILALEENGHKGKIMCVSESGLFPRVIGGYGSKKRLFITDEFIEKSGTISVADVFNAIGKEFFLQEGFELNFKDLFKIGHSPQKILRYEVIKTRKKRSWQESLYDTNNILNKIWHKLDMKSKNKIFRKYLKFFLI